MVYVKMNVQTAYHGELLREGKTYEIDETTAERWQSSNIAKIIDQNQENPKTK
ncbi:hypothetical protein [Sediminibacillus halophilus]|uniref:Uncharacterized protein n=1 Tax=Sediminibacillus halophilus TaxID=482461 RepID=A0A1G9M729_9BACI|nr:hypothetical protein [Sediminibacillus halophilus]SDL69495.1 hypothetical protein SAMN05216244_0434 [Sediminibacillus halophilus]